MKDHEIRELVSELTQVAREYGQTQQLRERIRGVVLPRLAEPHRLCHTWAGNKCRYCGVAYEGAANAR